MNTTSMNGGAAMASPITAPIGASVAAPPTAPAVPPSPCRRGARPRFTPAQVIDAIIASNGVKAGAGRILGCSGVTVANYIEAHADVRAAWEQIRARRQTC